MFLGSILHICNHEPAYVIMKKNSTRYVQYKLQHKIRLTV